MPHKTSSNPGAVLTTAEFAKACGTSPQVVSQAIRDGMPSDGKRRPYGRVGRETYMIDPEAAAEWAKVHRPRLFAKMGGLLASVESKPKRRPRKSKPAAKSGVRSGKTKPGAQPADAWQDTLDRARAAERSAHAKYIDLLESDRPAEAAALQDQWLKLLKEVRLMEVDAAKIEAARGESMPRAEVERIYFEAHGVCAQSLRNLAKKLAPMVVGRKDVIEVGQIVERETMECMRSIERSLDAIGKPGERKRR